jgi:spore cortex formation protein SpoVR/YcgB (stage V sporulation)
MHVARLWGFRVRLVEVDNMTGAKLREHETLPLP